MKMSEEEMRIIMIMMIIIIFIQNKQKQKKNIQRDKKQNMLMFGLTRTPQRVALKC